MPDKSEALGSSRGLEDQFDKELADEFDIGPIIRVKRAARDDSDYLMGRHERETERLKNQGLLYNPITRSLLEQAGLKPGMRVLDLGCGAGDVSLTAASIVGPSGQVTGVDCDTAVLEAARRRAEGLTHVDFRFVDLNEPQIEGEFDAIVGRLVLIYLRDPVSTLRHLSAHLAGPRIVAFQELDWAVGPVCNVQSPLLDQIFAWATEMFRRAGLDTRVGPNLRRIFLDAGLPEPTLCLQAPLGGGDHFAGYQYYEDSVRSGLPTLIRLNVATAEEVDIDTLAERLREEITTHGGVFGLPALVAAWAHKA